MPLRAVVKAAVMAPISCTGLTGEGSPPPRVLPGPPVPVAAGSAPHPARARPGERPPTRAGSAGRRAEV